MKKRKRIKLMLCMAFLLAMTNVLGVCAEEPDVEDKPALSLSVEGIPAEPEVGQTFELTVKIKNDGAQEASLDGYELVYRGDYVGDIMDLSFKTYTESDKIAAGATIEEKVACHLPDTLYLYGETITGYIALSKDYIYEPMQEISMTVSRKGEPAELTVGFSTDIKDGKIYTDEVYPFSMTVKNESNTVLRQVSIDVSFFFDGGTSEYDQLSFQEKEGLTIYDNLEGRLQFAEIDKLDPGETFTMEGAFKVGDVEYTQIGLYAGAFVWDEQAQKSVAFGSYVGDALTVVRGNAPKEETGGNTPSGNGGAAVDTNTPNTPAKETAEPEIQPVSTAGKVKTGDTSAVALTIMLMLASGVLATVLLKKKSL